MTKPPPPPPLAYLRLRTALVASLTLLAALLGFLSPSPSELRPPPTDALLFRPTLLDGPPGRVFSRDDGAYAFGRWRQPAGDVSFHSDEDEGAPAPLASLLRSKSWHYSSFNTDRFFVGMAIVKLGYLSDAFVYVVDKRAPALDKFEFSGRFPGSVGLTFASSSIDDSACTTFRSFDSDELSACYRSDSREWRVHINATVVGQHSRKHKRLVAELFMERQEALALLFPLGNDSMRPAYVHKAAGSPVRGVIALGDTEEQLEEHMNDRTRVALGALDWTRSHALRCTRWKWASASFRANVTIETSGSGDSRVTKEAAVGINLSADVYDIDGESVENAVWINGVVYPLRGVSFTVPQHRQEEWTIKSQAASDEESVDLRFAPLGCREDHTNLLVMTSEFVQPYGSFRGRVRLSTPDGLQRVSIDIRDAFGVVEDHLAVW